MTFSIVACDLERGDWGVAVASKFPAVGVVVPWARAGVGAVATQAFANADYGPQGLSLLGDGLPAAEALATLVEGDDGRAERQVGIVDAMGRAASFTGEGCMEWAGGLTGEGFACQGNILTSSVVVERMAETFAADDGELVDRLLAALSAGDGAGGDRRGKQSAAVLVVREGGGYGGRSDRYIDLRVDDHAEPVGELLRVFGVFDREYLIRNDPLMEATPELVEELQRRLAARSLYPGGITGEFDHATREALAAFAGEVNLEAKSRDDDHVYESIVRELRDLTADA